MHFSDEEADRSRRIGFNLHCEFPSIQEKRKGIYISREDPEISISRLRKPEQQVQNLLLWVNEKTSRKTGGLTKQGRKENKDKGRNKNVKTCWPFTNHCQMQFSEEEEEEADRRSRSRSRVSITGWRRWTLRCCASKRLRSMPICCNTRSKRQPSSEECVRWGRVRSWRHEMAGGESVRHGVHRSFSSSTLELQTLVWTRKH